ncbi:hypothetical protein Y032_0207g2003 [Ancylostoma ceylanicum]|uniref:Uncharacterized protein n=1 Tax=Ancylostoma ceylanicum TaxID=53326 RepID=A0A016SKW1_9BILA|nr:hypothetical protein Y032_0207g2003 [Ancylostoma ceylanicum]
MNLMSASPRIALSITSSHRWFAWLAFHESYLGKSLVGFRKTNLQSLKNTQTFLYRPLYCRTVALYFLTTDLKTGLI